MLSEQSMRNILVLRIQVVENNIGITGVTGREYNNLKVLGQILENVDSIRSDIDACLDDLTCGELDGQFHIVRDVHILVAVD